MNQTQVGEIISKEVDLGVIGRYMQDLPDKALQFGIRILLAVIALIVGIKVINIIRRIVNKSLKKSNTEIGAVQFIDSFIKYGLMILLIFMIATSLGLDATSVVAVVGSVGVAIGLALQGSLSNFAGGLLILLLKPFRVGDYIIENSKGNEGTVTEIQIFYTRLLTADHKMVIIPNGTLANSSMVNVTATPYRRMDIDVGISYNADIIKAKKVLEQIIAGDSAIVKQEEFSVFVKELEESNVKLCARLYVKNDDYWDTKWRMNEAFKLELDKAGIEIPFNQVEVHMK